MHEFQCMLNGVGPPMSTYLEVRVDDLMDDQIRIQRRPFGNRPHGT